MKKILITLRADLLDIRITDIVGNNVYLNYKPEEKESNMFIIYNIIDERPNTYVGNRALFTNYYIQIDIFVNDAKELILRAWRKTNTTNCKNTHIIIEYTKTTD